MLGGLAREVARRLFVSTVYTTGLTLLIPFVALFALPETLEVAPRGISPTLVWSAITMVLVSFLVEVWHTHSVGGSLKALGGLTFIPGCIGIVLSIVGRDAALHYLARTIPRFDQTKELVELYLDRAVPRVLYLTIGFFVMGMILLLVGGRLEARRTPK